jgi:gamma-polyglutamate biosynthesis protein CapA
MKKLAIAGALVVVATTIIFALPAQEHALPWSEPQEEPVRVLFVGDLMLDRNVARSAEERGVASLFASSTLELFADSDFQALNLEGTITDNPSIARQNSTILRFTFDPDLAREVLQMLRIDLISLANNHTLDFGDEGFEQTVQHFAIGGEGIFGHPLNDPTQFALSTEYPIGSGRKLCLVGYHSLFSADYTGVIDEIERLKASCWKKVVFAHWGDEYETVANAQQVEAAHAFIDAGADLVIGAHPHVVQNVEVYKERAIFYSLGNFMFDQNFSWEVQHGLAVRVDFYDDHTAFVLTPMTITDQRSSVATGADRQRVLKATQQVAEFQLP